MTTKKPDKSQLFRANVAGMILLALFLAIIMKLYGIQYFDHETYAEAARRQHVGTETLPPVTGSIVAGGEVFAASFRVKSFYTDPAFVEDKDAFAALAASATAMSPEEHGRFLERIKKTEPRPCRFAWIARKVGPETEERLLALKRETPGVFYVHEYKRFYPRGMMAAHVVGFRNLDEKAMEGTEYVMRRYLAGEAGRREFVRDALGNRIYVPDAANEPARKGCTVELTLDPQIQLFTEMAIDDLMQKHKPETATIIVIDAKTGAVLALSNRPSFNPNKVGESTAEMRKNHAVASIFEPGSIFKPFVAAAAIDAGVVTKNTKFDCHHGAYRIAGRTIHDAHDGGYGLLTVKEIVQVSSNIGMAQIAAKLGDKGEREAVRDFGFGSYTMCRMLGELKGQMTPASAWGLSTTVSVSFGQEIAVTPMQMAAGFNVFAADGYLMRPQIIKRITSPDGRVVSEMKPERIRRVLKDSTARVMKEILQAVVDEGTGQRARIPGYSVAGKTGTAQIAKVGERGYYEDKYTASFVCFAPVKEPEVTVLVTARGPKGVYYGGLVAAPAAREIVRKTLAHRGIKPAKETTASNAGE